MERKKLELTRDELVGNVVEVVRGMDVDRIANDIGAGQYYKVKGEGKELVYATINIEEDVDKVYKGHADKFTLIEVEEDGTLYIPEIEDGRLVRRDDCRYFNLDELEVILQGDKYMLYLAGEEFTGNADITIAEKEDYMIFVGEEEEIILRF